MKTMKENANVILLCIFEFIVGILLVINPIGAASLFIKIAGVVLLVFGFVEVVKYFSSDIEEAAAGKTLTGGILLLLGGLFCILKTEWFIATFPVLAVIYGIVILVTGVSKIQLTVDMLRRKNKKWFWAALTAAVSIACAVVILLNPFASTVVLWVFTGIVLVIEGVLDIVTMIMGKRA